MSEPTRWKVEELNCCFDADMVESSTGEYVLYSDYTRLKAEVDALKLGSLLTAVDVLQFIKLKEENERLRKAGDALYESEIGYYGEQILEDMKHHSGELCRNWNAAKEGKQP